MSDFNAKQYGVHNWTATSMAKPENLSLLETLSQDYSAVLNQGDCGVLFSTLADLLNKYQANLDSTIVKKYQQLIKIFGILSWHNRSDEEKKDYLTKDLLFILKKPLPIMALVSQEIDWYKWRFGEILTLYMSFMEKNSEQLGSQDQAFSFSNKESKPLVRNWLKDYIIFSGSPAQLNALNFMDYFAKSKNVKLLIPEELKILKRLFKLYMIFSTPTNNRDFFRQPYLFDVYFETGEEPGPTGAEVLNEIGFKSPQIVDAGQTSDYKNKLQVFKDHYKKVLLELIDRPKLTEELKGTRQSQAILDNLNSSLALKNVTATVANIQKIIEIKSLPQLIKSGYFSRPFSDFAQARLGSAGTSIISRLSPPSFSLFLQYLFVNRLKIEQKKAAVLAIYLGNKLADKQYLQMVYADVQTGDFKWREIKEIGGQLQFV